MFSSGPGNGNPFGADGPFSGGGFGDTPPSDDMFGGFDGGMDGDMFGLEPIDLDEPAIVHGFVDVGLHFHGAMRSMKKK